MANIPSTAVTLQAAADALGVRPQRVNQMLTEGILEGPDYEGRAPKGAGRVWRHSLAAEVARRSTSAERQVPVSPESVSHGSSTGADTADRDGLYFDLRQRELAARGAALEFKALADALRLELAEERSRAVRLEAENAELAARVGALDRQVSVDGRALEAYGNALSNWLGPAGAGDLDL